MRQALYPFYKDFVADSEGIQAVTSLGAAVVDEDGIFVVEDTGHAVTLNHNYR